MALHRPDRKLAEAKKYIDSLDDSKESDLIRYFVANKDNKIKKQREELSKYRKFFKQLEDFLPNTNSTIYR